MTSNIVDEVKSRCNIVDVIGSYVTVKRAGSTYKALCPFHNEKTPSFVINQDRQTFKCFGCGEGGDVISFVQKKENLDFREAVIKLADMYGIDTSDFGKGYNTNSKVLYEINREAALFYLNNLRENNGDNPGCRYFLGRGLDIKTMNRFGLGYAKDSWDDLLKHLTEKGYEEKDIYTAGLISKGDKGRYYNKFRNRAMFPIINVSGKVIGFGGRDLGDKGPKYLNSPESPIFIKGSNLFGLNLTRNEINKVSTAILVEGNMDLVSLYRHGVKNVCASLGTALTDNQCRMLKRYADTVILAYDSDAAGRKAALKGIEIIKRNGLKAKVMHVTDGKDPDDFIKKHGRLAFLELADNAMTYAGYKIDSLKQSFDLTTNEGSIDFLNAAKKEIFDGLSPAETEAYTREISNMTGISTAAVTRTLLDDRKAATAPGGAPAPDFKDKGRHAASLASAAREEHSPGADAIMQRTLIRILAQNPDLIEKIRLCESVFTDSRYKILYDAYVNQYLASLDRREKGDEPEDKDVTSLVKDLLDNDAAASLQAIIEQEIFPKNAEQVIDDCIEKLELRRIDERIADITRQLDFAQDDEARGLMEELMTLTARKNSRRG